MPLDPEPSPDGNVLIEQDQYGATKCIVLARDAERPAGRALYKSHFATCPQAAYHRRRK